MSPVLNRISGMPSTANGGTTYARRDPVSAVTANQIRAGRVLLRPQPGQRQGIGSRRQLLARREGSVRTGAAARPHADLHVAGFAGENAAVEIQLHREQAVAHGNVAFRHRAAHLGPGSGSVVESEPKIILTVGRAAAVSQAALVGKGRAHGSLDARLALELSPIRRLPLLGLRQSTCQQQRNQHSQYHASTHSQSFARFHDSPFFEILGLTGLRILPNTVRPTISP